MSIKVMTLVWSKSRNRRTALLLLLAIADHAHDDGKGAHPGIPLLAKKTRQTERNVQLLLKSLEDSKELKILEGAGPHGCNAYEINIKLLQSLEDWAQEDAEIADATGENFSPPKTFHPEIPRGENAGNFTPPVKNGANGDSENSQNKLENVGAPREISPKPLNRNSNRPIEPDTDIEKQKADVRAVIRGLFTIPGEFDFAQVDNLLDETRNAEILTQTAHQLRSTQSHPLFDFTAYARSVRFQYARSAQTRGGSP